MTERISGKVRVSIKDDDKGGRSLLITGDAINCEDTVQWLAAMGLQARGIGHILIANGSILPNADGSYSEFGQPCNHQTQADATRHAVHSLSEIFRKHDIASEVGQETAGRGFTTNAGIFERFTFGPGLA